MICGAYGPQEQPGDLPGVGSVLAMSALVLSQGLLVDEHAATAAGWTLKEHCLTLALV